MQAWRPIDFFFFKETSTVLSKDRPREIPVSRIFLIKATSIVHSNIQKILACTTARTCQQTIQRANCRVVWCNANKSEMIKNEQKHSDRLNEFEPIKTNSRKWERKREEEKARERNKALPVWQTLSGVFPAPRWSTRPAGRQHLPGRSWSPWCW